MLTCNIFRMSNNKVVNSVCMYIKLYLYHDRLIKRQTNKVTRLKVSSHTAQEIIRIKKVVWMRCFHWNWQSLPFLAYTPFLIKPFHLAISPLFRPVILLLILNFLFKKAYSFPNLSLLFNNFELFWGRGNKLFRGL